MEKILQCCIFYSCLRICCCGNGCGL